MILADLEPKKLEERRRNMFFIPRCLRPEMYRDIWDSDQTGKHS